MKLESVRQIKTWLYTYKSLAELAEHKRHMLAARFTIEKEGDLFIEFSQVIK